MTVQNDIHARATELRGFHPEWRYGQALFNAAMEICPIKAVAVIGTDKDPFHNDKATYASLEAMAA